MNDELAAPQTLILPRPRWPYLWPVLLIPAYGLNPAFHLAQGWNGSASHRLFGILLLLAALFGGLALSAGLLATRHWRELRIEEGRILLKPVIQVPRWARWSWQARLLRDGQLEVPLALASLEWVGKTLLLHGHPEMDVRLGRGEGAERIARWLVDRGLSEPVGR